MPSLKYKSHIIWTWQLMTKPKTNDYDSSVSNKQRILRYTHNFWTTKWTRNLE